MSEDRFWLRGWYRKYYLENPVGWLLAKLETELRLTKAGAPPPAEAGAPEQRYRYLLNAHGSPQAGIRFFLWSDEKQLEEALKATWHTPSRPQVALSDQLYLAAAALICATVLLIFYALRFPRPMLDVGFWGGALACVASLLPMTGAMRVVVLAPQVLAQESGLYVGLTRLRGRDIVQGALAFALPRAAQASAIYGLPLLFLIANIAQGKPWIAVPVALSLWAYGVALVPLWVALALWAGYGAAAQGARDAGAWAQAVSYILLSLAVAAAGAYGAASPLIVQPPPIHEWLQSPALLLSFAPPLPFASLLKVAYQPLGSLTMLLPTLLLGIVLLRLAERTLESGLRRRERLSDPEVEGWE